MSVDLNTDPRTHSRWLRRYSYFITSAATSAVLRSD